MKNAFTLFAYRHGQSLANVGLTWPDPVTIPLTELGHQQAQHLASNWTPESEPDLIITSNMLRTQQTAAPTNARFAHIETEVWPVHEFCYLSHVRCANTTWQQRQPWVEAYWAKADPHHTDGDGAESFADLMTRIHDTLSLIKIRQAQGYQKIALFSHGQFLSVLLDSLRLADMTASSEHMQRFRERELMHPIKNAEGFVARHDGIVTKGNHLFGWYVSTKAHTKT